MSGPIPNGGPAFPVTDGQTAHRVAMAATSKPGSTEADYIAAMARAMAGMTLRDWFATHAPPPPAWWLDQYGATTSLNEHGKLIADWNWAYADSMLAAREGQA
jgi:hypothetical protein